jgi:hypothetical protein
MSTAPFGAGPWEAPDLVATTPHNDWFLIVECTAGEPDKKGKLARLVSRGRRIQEACRVPTLLVSATSMPRSHVPKASLERAETDEVTVLAREDLLELFHAAVHGMDPPALRAWLSRRAAEWRLAEQVVWGEQEPPWPSGQRL